MTIYGSIISEGEARRIIWVNEEGRVIALDGNKPRRIPKHYLKGNFSKPICCPKCESRSVKYLTFDCYDTSFGVYKCRKCSFMFKMKTGVVAECRSA